VGVIGTYKADKKNALLEIALVNGLKNVRRGKAALRLTPKKGMGGGIQHHFDFVGLDLGWGVVYEEKNRKKKQSGLGGWENR